jgi:general secretion pathway protein D
MKKIKTLLLLLFSLPCVENLAQIQKHRAQSNQNDAEKIFRFDFTNKPLVDLIDEIAAEKKLNIILPQGATSIPADTKINYHLPEAVTIQNAWKILMSILDVAGYTIIEEGNMATIKKVNKDVIKTPLSLYIDENLDCLPDTEEIIRAFFYLKNLSIKGVWGNPTAGGLSAILTDMLSPNANIKSDAKINAILLTDKAANIKSAMKIILELDKGGMRDSIEVLPLYYTSAAIVDKLLNQQLLASKPTQPGAAAAPERVSYFPKNTKVIGLDRTNSLVIMGSRYGIDLVKDFIIKYIDRPLESGESILHVYDLQYLNAQEFAPILQQMVTPATTAQAAGQIITGPKQYFKDVIVQSELTRKTEEITPTVPGGAPISGAVQSTSSVTPATEGALIGGNKLIIAARKKDWIRIENLIKELDKPQPQVALEVLVVDVVLNDEKLLGHQMRNKKGFNQSISKNVDWQTAHLDVPILKPAVLVNNIPTRPADALMANLLQLGDPFSSTAGMGEENLASTREPGSLVFSLNDSETDALDISGNPIPGKGVWSVWQLLNRYTTATILSQPFIITKNHKSATVSIAEDRLLKGGADTANVAVSVNFEHVVAALTVDMLPHISASGNINLQIVVNVNEFASQQSNSRITRVVQTNANVGNNQILAIGGLTRDSVEIDVNKTPILADIPILGWFFKKKTKIKAKTNLLILISPKIIKPIVQGPMDKHTQTKIAFAQNDLDEELNFQNLRDPITRWFFKPDVCYGKKTISDYTKKTKYDEYDHTAEPVITNQNMIASQEPPMRLSSMDNKDAEELKMLVKGEENPLTLPASQEQADLQS